MSLKHQMGIDEVAGEWMRWQCLNDWIYSESQVVKTRAELSTCRGGSVVSSQNIIMTRYLSSIWDTGVATQLQENKCLGKLPAAALGRAKGKCGSSNAGGKAAATSQSEIIRTCFKAWRAGLEMRRSRQELWSERVQDWMPNRKVNVDRALLPCPLMRRVQFSEAAELG